jgi:hypothetical protein
VRTHSSFFAREVYDAKNAAYEAPTQPATTQAPMAADEATTANPGEAHLLAFRESAGQSTSEGAPRKPTDRNAAGERQRQCEGYIKKKKKNASPLRIQRLPHLCRAPTTSSSTTGEAERRIVGSCISTSES